MCDNLNPLQLVINIRNAISVVVLDAITIVVLISVKDAFAAIVVILVSRIKLTVTIGISVS